VPPEPSPAALSPEQAAAIAAVIAADPAGPYAPAALDALETIIAMLGPDGERRVTAALAAGQTPAGRTPPGRTPAGRTPSARTPADQTPEARRPGPRALGPPAVEALIALAYAQRRVVRLDYVDRGGRATADRPVEPHALAVAGGVKYLLAWCRWRGGPRWFRYDRVTSVALSDELVVEDRDIVALFSAGPPAATATRSGPSGPSGRAEPD